MHRSSRECARGSQLCTFLQSPHADTHPHSSVTKWTLLLATYITLLAFFQPMHTLGEDWQTWVRLFAAFDLRNGREKVLAIQTLAPLLGAWLGAAGLALDWARPWQVRMMKDRLVRKRQCKEERSDELALSPPPSFFSLHLSLPSIDQAWPVPNIVGCVIGAAIGNLLCIPVYVLDRPRPVPSSKQS